MRPGAACIVMLVVGLAAAASPAGAATMGVAGTTLTLDAGDVATQAETDLAIFFEPLDGRPSFSTAFRDLTPGPGCAARSDVVACPADGISALVVRGPRTSRAAISMTSVMRQDGVTPNVTSVVDAGSAADRIDTVNAIADTVSCGAGLDLIRADSRDTVEADCETPNNEGKVVARLLPGSNMATRAAKRVGPGDGTHPYGIDVRVTCPASAPDDSCGGKLDAFVAEPSIPKSRSFLGSEAYSILRGATKRVRVRLGAGASDGLTAASYTLQMKAIRSAIKKRGRARLRAQIRTGSSRFQHPFSVTAVR